MEGCMALLFSLKLLKRFILRRSLDFPLSAQAGCGIKKMPRRCYRPALWLYKWIQLYGALTGKINLLTCKFFEKYMGYCSFLEPDRHRTIIMDFHQHVRTELTCLRWDAMPAQQLDKSINQRLGNLRQSGVGERWTAAFA